MILLDVKAAFDSVWHNALISKMINLNFPLPLTKLINSFLKNREFRVHIGSCFSDKISVAAGCPQGSCISPVLYNIYTSDFPTLVDCNTSILADDTALICSEVLTEDMIRNLQLSMDTVLN